MIKVSVFSLDVIKEEIMKLSEKGQGLLEYCAILVLLMPILLLIQAMLARLGISLPDRLLQVLAVCGVG